MMYRNNFDSIKNVKNLYFCNDKSTFIENGLVVHNNVLTTFTNYVTNLEYPHYNEEPKEDLYINNVNIFELGEYCLSHQIKYKNIYISKNVKKINNFAFRGTKIKKVIIENEDVVLGKDLFDECNDLELVIVGNKIIYQK